MVVSVAYPKHVFSNQYCQYWKQVFSQGPKVILWALRSNSQFVTSIVSPHFSYCQTQRKKGNRAVKSNTKKATQSKVQFNHYPSCQITSQLAVAKQSIIQWTNSIKGTICICKTGKNSTAGTFLFVFVNNTCHYSPQYPLVSLLLISDRKSSRWYQMYLISLFYFILSPNSLRNTAGHVFWQR